MAPDSAPSAKVIQDKGGVFPSVAKSNPKVIQDKGGGVPSVATKLQK